MHSTFSPAMYETPVSSYLCQHLLVSSLDYTFSIAVLLGSKWCPIVALACISLMPKEVEDMFMCFLDTYIFSMKNKILFYWSVLWHPGQ